MFSWPKIRWIAPILTFAQSRTEAPKCRSEWNLVNNLEGLLLFFRIGFLTDKLFRCLIFCLITSWFYYVQFNHFWGFLVMSKKFLTPGHTWKTKILTKNTHNSLGEMIIKTGFLMRVKDHERLMLTGSTLLRLATNLWVWMSSFFWSCDKF